MELTRRAVDVPASQEITMKQLQDSLRTAKDALDEALSLSEGLGDPALYNQVDDSLSGVEGTLRDLNDLVRCDPAEI